MVMMNRKVSQITTSCTLSRQIFLSFLHFFFSLVYMCGGNNSQVTQRVAKEVMINGKIQKIMNKREREESESH